MTGKHFNKMVITSTFPADKWRGQDAWEADANLMAELVERVLIDGRGFVEIERSTVNLDGDALTDSGHHCGDGKPPLEFRWVTHGDVRVPSPLGDWHDFHWGAEDIARFTGGESLTLQVRVKQ